MKPTYDSHSHAARRRRNAARALLVFALLVASCVAASASQKREKQKRAEDEDEEVTRVETTLVTVPVTVSDHAGNYVTDLRREEFHVFEDGVEQQIAFFEPVEKSVTVALMLDVSDSTRFRIKDIQAAALDFINTLRPEDRVMIVAFDKSFRLLSEPTSDRAQLAEAVSQVGPGGGTSLYNAVDIVIKQLLANVRGRKAIVLLSDGEDTTSEGATYDSNMEDAEEFGGSVYTVRFNTWNPRFNVGVNQTGGITSAATEPSRLSRYSRQQVGERYLSELADRTGARSMSAETGNNLMESFRKIADELKRQYAVSYYPSQPPREGERRKLKVRIDRPKVSVRSRKEYVPRPNTDK